MIRGRLNITHFVFKPDSHTTPQSPTPFISYTPLDFRKAALLHSVSEPIKHVSLCAGEKQESNKVLQKTSFFKGHCLVLPAQTYIIGSSLRYVSQHFQSRETSFTNNCKKSLPFYPPCFPTFYTKQTFLLSPTATARPLFTCYFAPSASLSLQKPAIIYPQR